MARGEPLPDLGASSRTGRALERIRIVLMELPRMLRDIVSETIARQDDMLIVEETPGNDLPVPESPGRNAIDIVITGLEGDRLSDRCTTLMRRHAHLKVLGISGDARHAFLFELRPHRIPLGDASSEGLLDAIRAAVTAGNGGAR
jgi:hypothetical protein